MNDAIRHHVFKIPLNDDEDSQLRKLCASLGLQRAPFVRSLIREATTAHVRRRGERKERPRHGHIAVCPGRATFAGASRPLRV